MDTMSVPDLNEEYPTCNKHDGKTELKQKLREQMRDKSPPPKGKTHNINRRIVSHKHAKHDIQTQIAQEFIAEINNATPQNFKEIVEMLVADGVLFAEPGKHITDVEYYVAQLPRDNSDRRRVGMTKLTIPHAALCLAVCNKILSFYRH